MREKIYADTYIHAYIENNNFKISIKIWTPSEPTWLKLLCHVRASSWMLNTLLEEVQGSSFPTLMWWMDWFGNVIQFTISNPVISSPFWSKETWSPALLLNVTFFNKEWSYVIKESTRVCKKMSDISAPVIKFCFSSFVHSFVLDYTEVHEDMITVYWI